MLLPYTHYIHFKQRNCKIVKMMMMMMIIIMMMIMMMIIKRVFAAAHQHYH
jgi:hypothetical protein